ncbi:MAG: hypothetical protein KC917_15265, partial [Candidatus Omnitrophica bacterium]|nr:hypothetical protein [Candidatus Omnitrophota bacterium]
MPIKKILFVLVSLILLLGGYWFYRSTFGQPSADFHVSGDPIDIELVGIRPNSGDAIYDLEGNLIEERDFGLLYLPSWGDDVYLRQFLFKLADSEDPVRLLWTRPSERRGSVAIWSAFGQPLLEPGSNSLSKFYSIPKSKHHVFQPFNRLPWVGPYLSILKYDWDEPLTHVDVTVGCLKARRGPAELTFEGPFVFDRSTQAEEDANVSLTFQGDAPYSLTAMISLDNASRELSRDDVWCLYDLDGHRVIAQPDHSPPDIGKKVLEWRGEYFLNRVAAVTYNEKTHEKIFHNVPLDFPNWEDRNVTPDLEEFRRRFPEKSSSQRTRGRGVQFASLAEVFAASDILKGSMLRGAALNFVNREAEDLDKLRLSEQEKGKVNELLHRWLSVEEVMFQEKVIETGLGLRFPEFIDISLDWAFEHPLEFKGGAMTLYLGRMADQLTPAQFNRMADLFLNPETERTYESLWYWFEQQLDNPNAKDAKERLLKEGRVWHWWRIIESDLEGFRWDDHSPEKAKEILNRKREMGGLPLEGLRNTEDLNQTLSRWITPKLLT